LFKCGYVFVTRNPAFVRKSREYCLRSRLINERQEGPIVHQRELATTAWLRTGLASGEAIPRAHLVASCETVLRLRPEVSARVAARLSALTPEKLRQFELLLLDHRSVRRLADVTLNDEHVITDENAEQLLEAMRQATVEEEKTRFETTLREQAERHEAEREQLRVKNEEEIEQREAALRENNAALQEERNKVGLLATGRPSSDDAKRNRCRRWFEE
jgi:hypothetical protein